MRLLLGALALSNAVAVGAWGACSSDDGNAAPLDARRIAESALEREAAVSSNVVASHLDGRCAAVAFVTEPPTGHYVVVLRANADKWQVMQIADGDRDDQENLRQITRRSGYCDPARQEAIHRQPPNTQP